MESYPKDSHSSVALSKSFQFILFKLGVLKNNIPGLANIGRQNPNFILPTVNYWRFTDIPPSMVKQVPEIHEASSDHDIISQVKKVSLNSENIFDLDYIKDEFIVGTPKQVASKIAQFCEEGIEHFMIWFMDYPERTSMRIFAEKVIPLFENKY